MSGFQNDRQRQTAKRLRREMTDAERRLWYHLRAHRFFGLSVRRQAPIGPYIVDFLIPSRRTVIEVDGGHHDAATDAARTAFLNAKGYRVLRLWNLDVLTNTEGVLAHLAAELTR
ncbi:MAG: DUF559 domain-containing protein [Paracoccaceae bacterium]|nr:DUF559 domain-containing protein [Paracoccaceae bacterium]